MKKYWIFFVLPVLLFSCCKDDPVEPEIPGWKKFEGQYNVTKLESGETYSLRITFDSLISPTTNEPSFQIIYENFDENFDTLTGWYPNGTPDNELRIQNFNAPFGVNADDGSRWSLNMLPNDPDTPEQENTLVNDTILFCFRKINVAFYLEDGVPFYECECKHLAVKID